jgi:transposase
VDLAEVDRLLAEGHSLRAMARRMGLGFGTIHKAVRGTGGPSAVIENSKAVVL